MKISYLMLLMFSSVMLMGQNSITNAEWFLDTDPGFGNGNAFENFANAPTIETQVSFSNINSGLHQFCARVQDNVGQWSQTTCCPIFIDSRGRGSTINYLEWFIDRDPGFGNASSQSVQNSFIVEASWNINLEGITPGIHQICFRVRDVDGIWSKTVCKPFLMVSRSIAADINYLEWFWDQDPGFGNGNSVDITSGQQIEASWTIDLSNTLIGIHQLCYRVQNEDGAWSSTNCSQTYIRAPADQLIEKINYYYKDINENIDSFSYTLQDPQVMVEVSFDLVTNTLIQGQSYELCFNAEQSDGKRSADRCQTITWEMITSNEDVNLNSYFKVFPNPSHSIFNVEIPKGLSSDIHISLVNMQGQSLLKKVINYQDPTLFQIDVSQYTPGSYLIIFENNSMLHTRKLIIQD